MKAEREPKVAGAPQSKAKEEPDGDRAQNTNRAFSQVLQVKKAKTHRKQDCRRPEADRLRKRELGVATGEEFLIDGNHQEKRGPEDGKFQHARAVQREPFNVKTTGCTQGKQQHG